MSTEPLFGQAVHAPTLSEPNATPRVVVIHVAPSPMAAARINVKNEPNSRRISRRVAYWRSRDLPPLPYQAPPSRRRERQACATGLIAPRARGWRHRATVRSAPKCRYLCASAAQDVVLQCL